MGGRGGRVIEVTNLDDSGPGSLRAALEASGPRIVVFRVGGLITLAKPLAITHPFLTVAGQSAPGDGICIRGETTEINTHEVARAIRFRRGDLKRRDDALGGYPRRNVIIDHCSARRGLDENLSLYRWVENEPDGKIKKRPVENLTVQWCISSEAGPEPPRLRRNVGAAGTSRSTTTSSPATRGATRASATGTTSTTATTSSSTGSTGRWTAATPVPG